MSIQIDQVAADFLLVHLFPDKSNNQRIKSMNIPVLQFDL